MNLLRSEWTKLRSVRSTWIAAASAVASGVALSVLGASDLLGTSASDLPAGWDPTAESLKGFLFAQLIIGMLGAFSITPEFGTGMIGTSLVFVSSRSRLLAAKATVVAATGLVVSVVTTMLSFGIVQLMVKEADLPAAGLGDPRFGEFWPTTAGQAAYAVVPAAGTVAPGLGLFILAAAVLAAVVASHVAFRVRDI